METFTKTFRNIRNEHKYLEVKRTSDRHYLWRQRMTWDNGVSNPVGTPRGGFRRQSKATIDEVLEDYVEIGDGHD